ncbi:MAG: hypothetical protein MI674_02055, partial [Cytophagales bacterium]|nr:hypothetical protein [Cytophagales bacterium]
QALQQAASQGEAQIVEAILSNDQALDKVSQAALQATFHTAAGSDTTALIVTTILSNAQAQGKVGDATIANALKEASENNRIQVQESILAHWNAHSSFKDAVEKNEAHRVEALLKDPTKKAAIGEEAIQDGLKKAANAEPPKTAVMEAILNNLSADELGQALQQAASQGEAKVVEAIISNDQALDKVSQAALQAAFHTAAGEEAKAPIVTIILSNEAAQQKVGDATIADALKQASENNRIQVKESILAHWNAHSSFKDAVDKNEANRVEALLKDPTKKAAIGEQAIQDGLKETANDPAKTAVVKAILENLTPEETGQALQKAASKGEGKVVEAIISNALDKITVPALQAAFNTAAGEDATAPIVTIILSNEAAQQKVGDATIADTLKQASENNRIQVKQAILAHWNARSSFKDAVEKN